MIIYLQMSDQIDIKKLKSKSVYLPKGDKGISQMTEQIAYLDGNSK